MPASRSFLFIVVSVLVAASSASAGGSAHASPKSGETAPMESLELALGERTDGDIRTTAIARLGAEMEIDVQLTQQLAPPDPILGDASPLADADVTVTITSAAGVAVAGPLAAHAKGEAGHYGAHFPRLPAGSYLIAVALLREDRSLPAAMFPLAIGSAPMAASAPPAEGEHELTGHQAMTHPFLSHMGIPDGPGEVSVRLTGIRRESRAVAGDDVAFHIEAGIVDGLGIHLRNDAVTGAGAATGEDHGTELMLMYAPFKDAANTMGVSIFGELAVPTRRKELPAQAPMLATLPVTFGAGVGARYMWSTYVLVDAVVHVAPMDLYDGVMAGYEGSLQVRPIGRVFLVLETSGEVSPDGVENTVMPALKLGLGKTGATVGAGVAFATTPDRRFDRELLVQIDWGFE